MGPYAGVNYKSPNLIVNSLLKKEKLTTDCLQCYTIRSTVGRYIHTLKAPNFDRVFMENIFLLHNFVR
jgi:hypothetical protein